MSATTFIYGLIDPRTDELRWVGKSDDPQRRMLQHMARHTGTAPRIAWFRELRDRGIDPRVVILEEVATSDWQDAERRWIDDMRDDGHQLLNAIAGGTGGSHNAGMKLGPQSDEVKQRRLERRQQFQRRPMSAEGRRRLREARKLDPRIGERVEAMVAATRGVPKSAEHKAKIGAGNRGKTVSPETRQKLSATRLQRFVELNGDRNALILELRANGALLTEIAERTGLTTSGVRSVLRRVA